MSKELQTSCERGVEYQFQKKKIENLKKKIKKKKKEKSKKKKKIRKRRQRKKSRKLFSIISDKMYLWIFPLLLILSNTQRAAAIDTLFCSSYHGSSAPKKKSLSRKEEK